MKKINYLFTFIILTFVSIAVFTFHGCDGKPDLYLAQNIHSIDASAMQYVIKIKIGNQGNASTTTEAMVYINAISDVVHPGVNPIRIQKEIKVPPLSSGQISAEFIINFDMSEIHADEVRRFEILVDPKSLIDESNETNNRDAWSM